MKFHQLTMALGIILALLAFNSWADNGSISTSPDKNVAVDQGGNLKLVPSSKLLKAPPVGAVFSKERVYGMPPSADSTAVMPPGMSPQSSMPPGIPPQSSMPPGMPPQSSVPPSSGY